MLGNNAIAIIFEHCGPMTDLGLTDERRYVVGLYDIENCSIFPLSQHNKKAIL